MAETRNKVGVARALLCLIATGILGACDSSSVVGGADAGRMDVTDIGTSCTAPQTTCGGRCVDTQSDTANCGTCGTACATGQICSAGSCQVRCPAGATVCNGTCVNLQTDNANCGACGRACAAGQMCSLGACSTTCASSLATCGGGDAGAGSFCADLANDRLNCGACGNTCPAGNICVNRMCQVSCPGSQTLCNGACIDLQSNNANCGSCGNACAAGTACTAGTCALSCSAGITQCGSSCVNLQTDNNHCGACGTVCPAGQVCSGGACSTTCASPLTTCSGGGSSFCANTAIDPANCGACGTACTLANAAAQGCTSGTCSVVRCNPNFGDCDAMAANGCETDTRTSLQHCGGCGRACALANATATCNAGACAVMACATGFADCDGNPANGCEVNTRTDNGNCGACNTACSAGQVCSAGSCGATCASPLTTCSGSGGSFCANTTIDPANCGACGAACALANVASNGCTTGACSIVRCSTNFGDCDAMAANGCETDTRTSLQNCGGCGRACNLANATATCTAGACAVMACATGFADCDGNPANGCEVNTRTDNANCGACNTACTAGQVCGMGTCATTCASPLTTCSGACVNTSNDPAHCGACNTACPAAPNTIAVCAARNCAALCATGFGNCDSNLTNGCETNLTNSVTNCGGCGTICATRTNATSTCASGTCGFTCNAGFADCDGNAANGCEVNLTNDTTHCGSCNTVCPSLPGATASCASSACRSTCNAGFGDCDNNPANGCTSLVADNNNCGACGTVCSTGQVCSNSTCSQRSCRAIKMANPSSPSGIYLVDPDGPGGNDPFNVYCEMTIDGGGWTVMSYLRSNSQWDIQTFANSGTVGNTSAGFAQGQTLSQRGGTFTERIIIYLHLWELGSDLGTQWMVTTRADNSPVPYSSYTLQTGWSYRDSFGYTDTNAGNVCTHGCESYRGLGMFHDHTGISYSGTQTGNNGCQDGNNICWMARSLGCNVGASRCAYLSGTGQGVIYAAR